MEQYSKSESGFQHPSKEAGEHCSLCKHFEVLHHHGCEKVSGVILPGDYCKRFFLPISHVKNLLNKKE